MTNFSIPTTRDDMAAAVHVAAHLIAHLYLRLAPIEPTADYLEQVQHGLPQWVATGLTTDMRLDYNPDELVERQIKALMSGSLQEEMTFQRADAERKRADDTIIETIATAFWAGDLLQAEIDIAAVIRSDRWEDIARQVRRLRQSARELLATPGIQDAIHDLAPALASSTSLSVDEVHRIMRKHVRY